MKIAAFITLFVLALISFYKINLLNYNKSEEIRNSIITHPENLPTKSTAKNSTFGFANLRADFYWLQAVQYIGGNAISSNYKKYLYIILDLVTELNPNFEHPYIIGQLLLPSYNARYEDLSLEQQNINISQAVKIGEKGVKNFCNPEKLKLIKNEYNLNKLWNEDKYKDACKEADIPFKLAFIYQFYLHDGLTASYYYKVASVSRNALEGAKIMTAIMQGKGGDREKSFFMFLNMASTVEQNDQICIDFTNQLNSLALNGKLKNDTQTIKTIEDTRIKIFPLDIQKDQDNGLGNVQCSSFLNKAIRELNLSYIEAGHQEFLKTHREPLHNAKELLEEGYIDFLPTDPQQSKNQGIIYTYNNDLGHFDYEMGRY